MDPIQESIEAIEFREKSASFSYREVAKIFGVDRSTLSRRHQGKTQSYVQVGQQQQLLNPQQELELVQYVERCTMQGLLPTREMVQNFVSAVAKWKVSESWVTRFLHRHDADLTTKWSAGIDRNSHQPDSYDKYKLYFDLLHSKMREYDVDARSTYYMDEKGFSIGIANRSKRDFSKAIWETKERTAAIRDGNREWITLLACVCASGEALLPALIYEGKSGVQSSWVDDIEPGKHQIFVGNSPPGCSNNELGLAWLE
jgi:transposase